LTLLLLILLVRGWSIKGLPTIYLGSVAQQNQTPENLQPDGEQEPEQESSPELCPCGCNDPLDECDCPTAQRIKGEAQPTTEQFTQPIEISVDDDPSLGQRDAPVTIVEFSDYQCPFCVRAESTVKQILDTHGSKVRFVYRDYPLSFHQYAQKAAEASECADEQGKFWEYHDLLFEKQNEWSGIGISKFKEYAKQLGLDTQRFNRCLDEDEMAQEVKNDFQEGQSYGVSGTPAFFVNGQLISGAQPLEVFEQKIEELLK